MLKFNLDKSDIGQHFSKLCSKSYWNERDGTVYVTCEDMKCLQ